MPRILIASTLLLLVAAVQAETTTQSGSAATDSTPIITIQTDDLGRPVTKTIDTGVAEKQVWYYRYDLADHMIEATNPSGLRRHYTYNDASQPVQIDRGAANGTADRIVIAYRADGAISGMTINDQPVAVPENAQFEWRGPDLFIGGKPVDDTL